MDGDVSKLALFWGEEVSLMYQQETTQHEAL